MKRASGHGAGGASAGTPFCIVLAYDRAGLDCWNALDVVAGGQGLILRSSARDAAWQGDAAFYLQYYEYEFSYVYRATRLYISSASNYSFIWHQLSHLAKLS